MLREPCVNLTLTRKQCLRYDRHGHLTTVTTVLNVLASDSDGGGAGGGGVRNSCSYCCHASTLCRSNSRVDEKNASYRTTVKCNKDD